MDLSHWINNIDTAAFETKVLGVPGARNSVDILQAKHT